MKLRTRTLLAAVIAVGVAGGVVSPATAATYTRVQTCNSTGVTGYSATMTATWQTNSAGQADLVSTVTRYFQGVNTRDWATSATYAHRWAGVTKEFATVNPAQTSSATFPSSFYASKTTSEVYLAASDNARGIKCGPVVDNAN